MKGFVKGLFIFLLLFVSLTLVFPLKEAQAALTFNSRVFVGYRDSTTSLNTPKERLYGASATWSAEVEMSTAGSPVRHVKVAYCPNNTRFYEKIVVTQSDDGWLDAYVWNGYSWSVTNNIGQVLAAASALIVRPFDIAYEKTTGDALLVYGVLSGNGAQDLAYRTWNGVSWSAETYFDDGGHAGDIQYYWIVLATKPAPSANEIAMIAIDGTDSDVNGNTWTGTAWNLLTELDATGSNVNAEGIAVTYESVSYDAWFVWGSGSTANMIKVRNWYGTWNASTGQGNVGGTPAWITAKSDPASDKIMVTSLDGGADINMVYFLADRDRLEVNPGGFAEDASCEGGGVVRPADFEWEPTGSKGLVMFGDSNTDPITYQTFAGATKTWGVRNTYAAAAVTDQEWIQMRRDPRNLGKAKITIGVIDDAFDITVLYWDGAAFGGVLDISDSTAITYECFEIEYMLYMPTAATVKVVPNYQEKAVPFTITVEVVNAFELYGWEFKLNHTYTIISPTNVAVGDMLNNTATAQGGSTFGWVKEMSDNATHARVWATQTLIGDKRGGEGFGKFATITYNVDVAGGGQTSPLDIHDSKLIGYNYTGDKTTYYIPHAEVDGSVKNTLGGVPEFPLGAAMEITLLVAIVYVVWTRKNKIKTPRSVTK